MSKRKVTAGGYDASSDELQPDLEESPKRPSKRLPSVPYTPPRLTSASKSRLGAFQLPGTSGLPRASAPPGRHLSLPPGRNSSLPPGHHISSTSTSSKCSTLATESIDAENVPKTQLSEELDFGLNPIRRSSMVEIPSDKTSKAIFEPASVPHKTPSGRSTLLLERQINELTGTFEEYKSTTEARHRSSEGHLTRIFEVVNRLDPSNPNLPNPQASTPFPTTSTALLDVKPVFSNPIATPELIEIVSKVVSEARGRVGKKKGGADDNSCKEHARNTFYRMLGIAVASEIHPYFEDEYGEPDTLPAQFADPDSKYCCPYPHWKSSLVKQIAWVPTYVLRFKSTIPHDQTELSTMLRNLTDEQILVLLNDGPFKSACAAWRNAKKSESEIEVMRSIARRYQRCDKKATIRATHIRAISSLQGPGWEYLSHTGYVSQDESDEEGRLTTKRPEQRARWEINLYEAILIAERKKARARPGLCPRMLPIRVELVRRPTPHLERGSGSSKVTVRIALCGVSKSWRERYPEEIQKNIHLFNMKEAIKPDISSFLIKHPMPDIDSDASIKDGSMPDNASDSELWAYGTQVEGQMDEGCGYGMNFGVGMGADIPGGQTDEGGAILGVHDDLQEDGVMGVVPAQGPKARMGNLNTGHIEIPIDPLLCNATVNSNDCFGANVLLPLHESKDVSGVPLPTLGFQMPPPPPLNHELTTAGDEQVVNEKQIKGKVKKEKKVMVVVDPASADEAPTGPVPKRRGRPPGSKNKSKPL